VSFYELDKLLQLQHIAVLL